jgi:two-component system, sensor histidine kinase
MKIIIEITDNGVGITPEKIKSVFMNFNSLAEHQKMNPRGTGLGLSICKNLIEKMGGQVNVSSLQGKGTTFSVEMMALCRHGSDKRKDFNKKDQEKY